MSYGLLVIAIQIGFAWHALRRGQDFIWVFLIVFVPVLGCVLYTLMVLLPEARQSRTARRTGRTLHDLVDPKRGLEEQLGQLDLSDTVENRTRLADELMKHGRIEEAVALYEKSLTGIYAHDPGLMLGYAAALFAQGEAGRARQVLDDLKTHNPQHRTQDGHLLYARTLEALDDTHAALEEYAVLDRYYAGAEAKCRHGMLLERLGRHAEARLCFEEVVKFARQTSRHGRELNREWIAKAKEGLATLDAP
ncbi:MAG: tetratricopeptide repeat protein [Gammaproteobacteria bacterium]|nr:tetratricopeptide repeat protein [Gammaproteobacteria bacterium]